MIQLQFRPHHFLCTLCFKGNGYSPAFVKNFQHILSQLNSDNSVQIEVVAKTDDICDPCPHRAQSVCMGESKISIIDQEHRDVLKIAIGDIFTWDQAKKRISQHMTLDQFHKICATCDWKKYRICETVLANFLQHGEKNAG